jgi:hypothetical protein
LLAATCTKIINVSTIAMHTPLPEWVILDCDGQGPGSYMSASTPIATVSNQGVIRREGP